MSKGQIQLTLLGGMTAIAFVVSPVVSYFSAVRATDAKIAEIKERTAVLENSIINTDKSIAEMKTDLREIKRALNVR